MGHRTEGLQKEIERLHPHLNRNTFYPIQVTKPLGLRFRKFAAAVRNGHCPGAHGNGSSKLRLDLISLCQAGLTPDAYRRRNRATPSPREVF
ncbi:hypothetical protein M404DRAFT_996454 [Pisolithus tinctorius Marx 270]|uniref:Uncharacterized protein n=1 Tax=Pisolithus tinctorius Marx 270 TaxID=870435 RepID=A0A0C3P832_PISTI|nr:hypothetical protein M404DRAFT_996454 [Pisolithus tinctorius Marx 270]